MIKRYKKNKFNIRFITTFFFHSQLSLLTSHRLPMELATSRFFGTTNFLYSPLTSYSSFLLQPTTYYFLIPHHSFLTLYRPEFSILFYLLFFYRLLTYLLPLTSYLLLLFPHSSFLTSELYLINISPTHSPALQYNKMAD